MGVDLKIVYFDEIIVLVVKDFMLKGFGFGDFRCRSLGDAQAGTLSA